MDLMLASEYKMEYTRSGPVQRVMGGVLIFIIRGMEIGSKTLSVGRVELDHCWVGVWDASRPGG